jgi:hypothetical protein
LQTALKAAAALVIATTLAATPVRSETQTENIVAEQRTSVSVRIAPEAAQALLPAGWTPNAAGAGPTLTIIFMDRKLALTPDGKPLQSGVNRLMVLAMSARNAATGQVRSMIVGGYSTDPQGAPGAYKVYRPGAVSLTRTERTDPAGARLETTVEEHWTAKGADGATVTFDLMFTRGTPTLNTFQSNNYSGAEPDFYRTYRGQQASEIVRNTAGVDRVRLVALKASGGALGKAVDGSEQIVSITSAPFYSRLTFVP